MDDWEYKDIYIPIEGGEMEQAEGRLHAEGWQVVSQEQRFMTCLIYESGTSYSPYEEGKAPLPGRQLLKVFDGWMVKAKRRKP